LISWHLIWFRLMILYLWFYLDAILPFISYHFMDFDFDFYFDDLLLILISHFISFHFFQISFIYFISDFDFDFDFISLITLYSTLLTTFISWFWFYLIRQGQGVI
jgi:hypothetical protein